MAHIWLKSEIGAPWSSCGLSEGVVTLTPVATGLRLDSATVLPTPRERVVLYESSLPNGSRQWILLAPPQLGVRVNGWPADLALVALQDRDEIRLPGLIPAFFSTERLAVVTSFGGANRPLKCPRCRDVIEPGCSAVQCPNCGMWHHQSADRGCWTYAESCAVCDQSTALDAGYQWRPEALEL